ncbi:MAG: NnrS family protein [Rhodospirillales bacterium]|nr:NnrS family protein [Rhodospirillales bacterium]
MPHRSLLLTAPHRPFFLAAGIFPVVAMSLWLAAWSGRLHLTATWHGHEMIFGLGAAAIAGFLLTAVPTWIHRPPVQGLPLLALLLLWLIGRIAMLIGWAPWLDLLFLPTLAGVVGWGIVRARNVRNYPVPALLLVLSLCNADYHFGDASRGLWLATLLVTAMIALIGGRITPLFTQNALRQSVGPEITCGTPPWLDRLAVPAVLAALAAEIAAPQTSWSGAAALLAAAILGARMLGWQTWRTVRFPILWVLHAGYAWVPVGYALIAISLLTDGMVPTAALHALSAGAMGVMILAVMSRAALGHSGRPLMTPRLTVIAYALVNLGAIIRMAVPSHGGILVSGLVWTAGYALFVIDYWSILTGPRLDSRPV